jgi:hypothetical protein
VGLEVAAWGVAALLAGLPLYWWRTRATEIASRMKAS